MARYKNHLKLEKMKKLFVLCLLTTLVYAPITGQTKKEKRTEKAAKDFEKMKDLIDGKTYSFEAEWATTQQGQRINLITNPNYMEINKDSADIRLPYFGIGHTSTMAYNSTDGGGIVFKGAIENYEVSVNDKKQKIIIKFIGNSKIESSNFLLTVFKSGSSQLSVSSSIRSNITYDGNTGKIKSRE